MQYLAGLLVFSGIGSFLISDTIDFGRELRKSNSLSRLYLDFFRLLILVGMALIGYMVALETFHKPNDWIVFLVIGIMGAFSIHILGVKQRFAAKKGARKQQALLRHSLSKIMPAIVRKSYSQARDPAPTDHNAPDQKP